MTESMKKADQAGLEGEAGDSWREMLRARPVRNAAAAVRSEGTNGLRLSVKKRRLGFLVPPLTWIVKPRGTKEFEIDALGAVVWELCDGERTVEDVVDDFARRHGLTFHESRVAVTGYMKSLVQRGALAMVS